MNRQQWAITLTGVGAILMLTVFLAGGPSFESGCTGNDCDGEFSEFLFAILWTFFAMAFGGILLLVGIILFIVEAAQTPVSDETDD